MRQFSFTLLMNDAATVIEGSTRGTLRSATASKARTQGLKGARGSKRALFPSEAASMSLRPFGPPIHGKGPQGSAKVRKGPQGSARVRKGPQGSTRVRKGPRGSTRVRRGRAPKVLKGRFKTFETAFQKF